MITYWTFKGEYPLVIFFPGLPLLGFVGMFTIQALIGESGVRWSVMVAIVGGDLLLGAIWLWSRSTNASAKTVFALTLVTLVAALGIVFSPVIERKTNISVSSVYQALFGPLPRAEAFEFNEMNGEITITSADIGPSYMVPDRSDFVRAALSFDTRERDYKSLNSHTEKAESLLSDVVDNEIRVYGIQEGFESVYVTVFAEIETDPEKIDGSERMKHPKWRVLPGKLIDITSSDLKRGYVTLPLITENLTLINRRFYDKDGHESYMYRIAWDFQNKEKRLSNVFNNGRYSKGL